MDCDCFRTNSYLTISFELNHEQIGIYPSHHPYIPIYSNGLSIGGEGGIVNHQHKLGRKHGALSFSKCVDQKSMVTSWWYAMIYVNVLPRCVDIISSLACMDISTEMIFS